MIMVKIAGDIFSRLGAIFLFFWGEILVKSEKKSYGRCLFLYFSSSKQRPPPFCAVPPHAMAHLAIDAFFSDCRNQIDKKRID